MLWFDLKILIPDSFELKRLSTWFIVLYMITIHSATILASIWSNWFHLVILVCFPWSTIFKKMATLFCVCWNFNILCNVYCSDLGFRFCCSGCSSQSHWRCSYSEAMQIEGIPFSMLLLFWIFVCFSVAWLLKLHIIWLHLT